MCRKIENETNDYRAYQDSREQWHKDTFNEVFRILQQYSKSIREASDTKVDDKYYELRDNADRITLNLIEILLSKHQDYGTSNISDAPGGPLIGLSVRLHDKIARLNNLLSSGNSPRHESIEDTFIDIANYAIIGLLVLEDNWK
jgi:hypothetical protein